MIHCILLIPISYQKLANQEREKYEENISKAVKERQKETLISELFIKVKSKNQLVDISKRPFPGQRIVRRASANVLKLSQLISIIPCLTYPVRGIPFIRQMIWSKLSFTTSTTPFFDTRAQ